MTQGNAVPHASSGGDEVVPQRNSPDDCAPTSHNRRFKILVVDDFEDNRELLRRRLNRLGHEVVEASDGFEALRTVNQECVDLVLLDIMMPGMEGTEVVETIRRTWSSLQLPVIMVSAKDQSDDVAYCLKLGANDYITKPIDFTVAMARIEAHLERKRDHEISFEQLVNDEAARLTQAVRESYETFRRTDDRHERRTDKRRQTGEDVQYLLDHDGLTGLENRVAFYKRLEECLASPEAALREPVLLFVDLERFKSINDAHGHLVGDQLLQDVAFRLRDVVGDRAVLARLGSDEFAVLFLEEGHEGAGLELGESIIAAFAEPFDVSGREFWLRATCGIARAASCGERPDVLMRAADLAMRRAKAEGRSRITVFEPNLLEAQRERSTMEVDLRRALHQGELELYYQPVIRVSDHKVSCFEALVRWNHPQKGVVHPEAFMSVAEEVGLSREIDHWILAEACREAADWPANLHIAVNVSPAQFVSPDLATVIRSVLEGSGLPPNRLELEITESSLLDAADRSTVILEGLRNIGVRVSIDDFGTGYSSMGYLKDFQFNRLKIDRRFIECIGRNTTSTEVVRAIADLGIRIGIDTTAEGVETCSQFAAVVEHGCSEVQGFYVSKPLTATGAREFIVRL